METKMHNIVELGTPGCDYTGGGIWVSYIPVLIDGEKAQLWYDSESYDYDDEDTVEFSVWDSDDDGCEMLTKYFTDGTYVGTKKDSPYLDLFKKLRKAMKKALKTQHPFNSVPFERKSYNEWVYITDVKTDRTPVTVLFKEVWMVHKAIAYVSKERAAEWKSYDNAVNITYHYDDDDNMVITEALPMKKKGE